MILEPNAYKNDELRASSIQWYYTWLFYIQICIMFSGPEIVVIDEEDVGTEQKEAKQTQAKKSNCGNIDHYL